MVFIFFFDFELNISLKKIFVSVSSQKIISSLLFHIENNSGQFALIVTRKIYINNTNVIRIVDFEGDET